MPTAVIQHDLKAGQSVVLSFRDMPISRATGWRVKASTPCLEGGLLAGICALVLQACQLGSCCYDRIDEVGLIVVGHPLQNLHTTGMWLSLSTQSSASHQGRLAATENTCYKNVDLQLSSLTSGFSQVF